VKLEDIKAQQQKSSIEPNRPHVVPPLAIVNACSSARDRGLASLHNMLALTHRGMIGTEIDIPDAVAAELSMELYRLLLQKKPLGESLLRARQFLLDKRTNPLGLAYTLHADPDLKIAESSVEPERGA